MALRTKKPSLILAFSATAQAMAVEKFCQTEGLPGRLIPVPKEITAGCGLAWKAPVEERERLTAALTAAGLDYSGVYIVDTY